MPAALLWKCLATTSKSRLEKPDNHGEQARLGGCAFDVGRSGPEQLAQNKEQL